MKFEITGLQLTKILEWEAQQNEKVIESQGNDEPNYGTIGGGFTYEFTPTSLGVVIKATNGVTGETIDVSDYHLW